jgi:hypothetical protein
VHFAMAALLEQAASVQRVVIAVLAMQVVGMVQEPMALGSQQPLTPLRVFVAQMLLELEHVSDDAVRC